MLTMDENAVIICYKQSLGNSMSTAAHRMRK